ncbi:MAG: hypothetical protein IKY22_02100 [Bacteroidales bacterium]|nr:hypothetical protein [Bacteroidales bacterium]
MRQLFRIMMFVGLIGMAGCNSNNEQKVTILEKYASLPEEYAEYCSEWPSLLESVHEIVKSYEMVKEVKIYKGLVELCPTIEFTKDIDGLSAEHRLICQKVKNSVDSTRVALENYLAEELAEMRFSLNDVKDYLIEDVTESVHYLNKGTKIYYTIKSEGQLTLKIHNTDAKTTLKTYSNKSYICDSMEIKNSAIYLFELLPKGGVYVDVNIDARYAEIDHLLNQKTVSRERVEGKANDFRVTKVDGVKMQNLFEEPRKFTLRSQGKSMFSGSARATIPIQIPAGTTDLLYSLRISTNEGSRSSDGNFDENLNATYKEVKFMGRTVYESKERRTSLLRELLYGNEPPREEEAYCNVFVFTNSAQAKKFQDGAGTTSLSYNIDLSLLGTQSCNGRIPCNGMRTIYFGFENERFRYSNYLWLEVVAVTPQTEYYKYIYRVD